MAVIGSASDDAEAGKKEGGKRSIVRLFIGDQNDMIKPNAVQKSSYRADHSACHDTLCG